MPLVVDTYNVLHVTGILPPDLAGIGVEGLADLLGRSRYDREPTVLVCDGTARGKPRAGLRGRVEVRYAGPGRTADEVIARLVERSTAPRRLTVVSSDRAVARSARRRRCRVLTSEAFLRQLAADATRERPPEPPGRPDGPLSEEEVRQWTAELGLDAEALAGELAAADEVVEPPAGGSPPGEPAPASGAAPDAAPGDVEGPTLPPRLVREAERLWSDDESQG
ncbi:MAG: NYN domain-containing protein [Planctomycetota bacterium]|jgi:predicted RNA-binding protein with PIN domain